MDHKNKDKNKREDIEFPNFDTFLIQTCIAPDYILCTENQRDTLISNMVPLLKEWLGDRPQDSKDFGRIVNERHFDRVMNLLNTTSGTIAHGERIPSDSLLYASQSQSDQG